MPAISYGDEYICDSLAEISTKELKLTTEKVVVQEVDGEHRLMHNYVHLFSVIAISDGEICINRNEISTLILNNIIKAWRSEFEGYRFKVS